MSLNKTLDRLFDEIRREAKRNPDFANRLDAVLRLHESQRDVPDEVLEEVGASGPPASSRPVKAEKPKFKPIEAPPASRMPAVQTAPSLNPVGLFRREGEDALTEALIAIDGAALKALIVEHNLDPAGETGAMNDAERVAHIVAQAKRRAARDEKMFDY